MSGKAPNKIIFFLLFSVLNVCGIMSNHGTAPYIISGIFAIPQIIAANYIYKCVIDKCLGDPIYGTFVFEALHGLHFVI